MPLALKVNGPEGKSAVLKGLDDGLTLQQLKDKVAEALGVPAAEQSGQLVLLWRSSIRRQTS